MRANGPSRLRPRWPPERQYGQRGDPRRDPSWPPPAGACEGRQPPDDELVEPLPPPPRSGHPVEGAGSRSGWPALPEPEPASAPALGVAAHHRLRARRSAPVRPQLLLPQCAPPPRPAYARPPRPQAELLPPPPGLKSSPARVAPPLAWRPRASAQPGRAGAPLVRWLSARAEPPRFAPGVPQAQGCQLGPSAPQWAAWQDHPRWRQVH